MARPGKFDAYRKEAKRLWFEGYSLSKILIFFQAEGVKIPKTTVHDWLKQFVREEGGPIAPSSESGSKSKNNSEPDSELNKDDSPRNVSPEELERFRAQLNKQDPETTLERAERELFGIIDTYTVSASVRIQALNAIIKLGMWREDREAAVKSAANDDDDESNTILIEFEAADVDPD